MKKQYFLFTFLLLIGLVFSIKSTQAQGCEDPPSSDDGSKLFGYFQPQFNYELTEPENESTFKFKRARLGVTGNIPYDFSYYFVMENSAFVSSTGYPYLLDAFISYKRYKWLKVSVGSFKQPFGQEVNTSCSGLHTIERSLASDYFVAPQRDMGIMFLGGDNSSFFQYYFALMNGKGVGIKDNNLKKDLVGRITLHPLKALGSENYEWLRIGGSFRYGYPNPTEKDRLSYAAELQIKQNSLLFQAEYIYDEGDYVIGGGGCGATESIGFADGRNGAYAMLMYRLPMNLEPVVKYEFMNTNLDDSDSNIQYSIITAGFNYWFNDWTRLQLNYRYRAEQNAEKANDEILIQMQVKF